MTNRELASKARDLANALAADLDNTSSRIEHIRISVFALEADRIARELEGLAHEQEIGQP